MEEIKIFGEKVYIRVITDEDTGLIVKWRNQENIRKYFFFREKFTEDIHRNWMETKVNTGKVVQFIVCLIDGNIPIGSTYLRDINKDSKTAEYGVFIGEESARGKGIGKEILKLTLEYAWEKLGLEKIYARAISTNEASVNSFLKSGFKQEEVVRNVSCSDGKKVDMVFLSICKENYQH